MILKSWTVFTGLKIFTAQKDREREREEKKVKDKSSQGGRSWKERKQINKQKYRQSLAQQPWLGGLGGCQGSPAPLNPPNAWGTQRDTSGRAPCTHALPSC